MTGSALRTISPSSSRITRRTPCVDGCCGPMLRTIGWAGPTGISRVVVFIIQALSASLAETCNGIIFSEGVSLPFIRHQNAAKIGMAVEANTKKIERLALMPVGRGPNRRDGMHDGIPTRQPDFHAKARPLFK